MHVCVVKMRTLGRIKTIFWGPIAVINVLEMPPNSDSKLWIGRRPRLSRSRPVLLAG
jgi:hypothetical protein